MRTFKPALPEHSEWLSKLRTEHQELQRAIDEFHIAPKQNEAVCSETAQKVIKVIDQVMASGDWNASLYLRSAVKPLQNLKEQAQQMLQTLQKNENMVANKGPQEQEMRIYISLYQSYGYDLGKWQALLRSLPSCVQGRPVYRSEAHVQKALRLKPDAVNEAYAVVLVKKVALMNSANFRRRQDQCGSDLLQLTPGAVQVDKIERFVHGHEQYRWCAETQSLELMNSDSLNNLNKEV